MPSESILHHAGFWIPAGERTAVLLFFRELLGFCEVSAAPRRGGGERLFLRNSAGQYLELLVADDVETLDRQPWHPRDRVAGVPHLCFRVADIDTARAVAERHGGKITLQAPADGGFVTSELGEHRVLFVQAPGRVSVELFEFRHELQP